MVFKVVDLRGLQSFHHNKPVRTTHTDRTTKSEMQHLQVIKDWASNQHGVSCLKVVRVNEYRDTHGRRVRLFKQSATGRNGATGRETGAFLPCRSKIVAPWIVAGQGKSEFPVCMHRRGRKASKTEMNRNPLVRSVVSWRGGP